MSQLFFAARYKLALCPTIHDAITAQTSYISSPAVVILGNPGWLARNVAICFWQCSRKSASYRFSQVVNTPRGVSGTGRGRPNG
jgi:hypothetical protein